MACVREVNKSSQPNMKTWSVACVWEEKQHNTSSLPVLYRSSCMRLERETTQTVACIVYERKTRQHKLLPV